jgi:HSP20 family protein
MYMNEWAFSNVLQDMERFLEQVSRSVSTARVGTPFLGHSMPALNVWENDDAFVVTGEMPGVDPDSIGISVLGDTLTVSGKRVFDYGQNQEIDRTKEFNRSIQMPYRVDADRTEAHCRDGVLTVVLHRPESEKPRKITVQST